MEWISRFFLTGYAQSNRASSFNNLLVKIMHFLSDACVKEGCSASLRIASEKKT